MLRAVHLHGRLGTKFGRKHDLAVGSTAEAVHALAVQLPGFSDYIRHRGYVISVGEGGTVIGEEQLPMRLGRQRDIHITPAGMVSGIETIILGGILLFTALSTVMMLSMPKAPKAATREEATKTASFIFDGPENVTEQGHPVPLIYGWFRSGSVVVSAGITTTDVNEASVGTNPTNPIADWWDDHFGLPYEGYVGSTPGIVGSASGREWVDVQLAKGGKGASGSTRAAQEDPNTLQSQATAKVVDVISEGEIVGLVDGLKSVFFDGTPLQNADGTFNFAGVAVEQRVGLPDQDFMPGFSQAENSRAIDTDVTVALGPVTRSIEDASATVARVTIGLNQLFQQDTENGDLKSTTVVVKISVQADGGGFTDVHTMEFAGKTNSGYQRSVDIRLPNGEDREVRITRITADSEVASLSNDTRWELLTEVVEAKQTYPDTALIGLTVDARQFGSNIPTRSYEVKGLIIEVPTNYDPETRAYDGIWDGTFKRAWTDNPAWVLRDIITNRRYGLGKRVPPEALDIWGLYAIAQYCDGMIPDGFGGERARFTINCCINNPAAAYDVIATLASVFRGWGYWGSGSVMFAQDRPEDPSILITPSNTVSGRISYGRVTPFERRRSVAVVWWNDPDDNFRLVPEFHEEPALVRRFGRREGDHVTAFGVTNRGQANNLARWILEDEAPGSNTSAAYEVGDDHGFAAPGRIAMVADPMFAQHRRGGRVRAATADSITLDAAHTFVAGQNYSLRVLMPDGTVSIRPVLNGPGAAVLVNLDGDDWITPPNAGAVWTIESDVVANRQFRVRSIGTDEPPYRVKAVLHDPTKYERVEQDRDISTSNFLDLPTGPLVPPGLIDAFEFLLRDGDAAIPSVQVSWQASPDPRITFYQAQFRRPGGNFEPLGEGSDLSRVVRGSEPGEWTFRVRALDSTGRKTHWAERSFELDGQVDALPAVIGLSVLRDDDALQSMLVWVKPVDHRPLRYQVLFDAAGVFANAIELGIVDSQEYVISQIGTYWVRTIFINAVQAAPPSVDVEAGDLPIPPAIADQGDLATLDVVNLGAAGQVVRQDGSTHVTDAAAITALGTAASIAGQGALATISQVNLGASGRVYREDGSTRLTDAVAVTSLGTASAIASQGALATLSQVALGASGRVYRDDGTTRLTDALAVTSIGTAAAIASQGAYATLSETYFGDGRLRETSGGTSATLSVFKTSLGVASAIASQGALATLGQVNLGATGRVYRDDGVTRLTDTLAVTSIGTAAAISGQGAFATVSTAAYGSGLLTGFGTLAPRNTVRLANEVYRADGSTLLTDALAVTSLGTAAAISGQGALATLGQVNLGAGGRVYRDDGTTRVTDSIAITSLGTAAGIASQGAYATLNETYFGDGLLRESAGGSTATLSVFKTALGTAASISGQGSLATRGDVYFGSSYLLESSGGSQATLSTFKTALGTAAAIASQGSLATRGDVYFGSAFLLETSGGSQATLPNFKTAIGTAAAIAGQGAGATANNLTQLNAAEGAKLAGMIAGAGPPVGLTQINGTTTTTLAGTTITSTNGGDASGMVGSPLSGAQLVALDVYPAAVHTVIGFHTAAAGNTSNQLVWAAYHYGTGQAQLWSAGVQIFNIAIAANLTGPFALVYDNNRIHFQIGATRYGTPLVVGADLLLYPKFWAYQANTLYTGLRHAPAAIQPDINLNVVDGGASFATLARTDLRTNLGTAAAITSQGALATRADVYFGSSYLLESSGGTQATLGTFKTSLGTSAAISGQGALATLGQVNFGASGRVYRDDGVTRITDALAVTSLGTAASIASQGALATRGDVYFGSAFVLETSGGSQATLANFKTGLGTAAAISGQGSLATLSAVSLDSQVNDGTTYKKVAAADVGTGGALKLTQAGSGRKLGDARNLPNVVVFNLGSKFTGTVSYTSAAGTPATATISVTAGNAVSGSVTTSYNAMSVGVSGTGGTTVQFFLYVDDAPNAGGTQTLVATTTALTVYQGDGRLYIGECQVFFPAAGTGGGGGSGGGGECVAADAWVETRHDGWVLARDVRPGMELRVLTDDRASTRWEPCEAISVHTQPGWRLRSASGITCGVSESTPITLHDGRCIRVPEVAGHALPLFRDDQLMWEACWAEPIGPIEVARIVCNQCTYAAGDRPGFAIMTHNPKP